MTRSITIVFSAVFCVAAASVSPASAQATFQSYRCADRTQFIVAFYDHDSRAHMQVDGHEATLARRFAVSGARYAGGGVTLSMGKQGTTLKHLRRPVTRCEVI